MLFDVEKDPQQHHPIQDDELEQRMITLMLGLMAEHDSPEEQYVRLGLERF
ncbi:putative sulfatase [Paenibacillus agaridevorans]|uniref:Putative sulfatase n=1 Tax=Paenibacillus agaridevorans TaxID=171404 RepID=A0A2R5EKI1_9BACL|nr:hypothetical protein [Paenibacillus agaridevorans]GBG07136.1 putative sulfatase [Paenibacillus agaridevorans]